MSKGRNNNNRNGRKDVGASANMRGRGNKAQGKQKDVMGTPYREQLNKRNSSKGQRQAEDVADTAAAMSRDNPERFYTKFDTFVTDAAKLPFAKPLGSTVTVNAGFAAEELSAKFIVPGVMSIEFVPTIGISKDFSSPINRSSIRFYTYLRSNQKASATYDHQDVTMMEISLDSCYMFHGLMSKVYSIINQFTPVNEYYSRATVAACRADFDDIRAHLQDFRAYINTFAYSLGQYALPSGITLFERHRWMVEGMYTDSTSTRAQTYMFVPAGFWLYNNTVETGSQCTFEAYSVSGKLYKYEDFKAFGDKLLNAISGDEDFAVISGDIYNFYGGDTYKLPYIDENYSVLPAYEEVVLSQIENATVVPLDKSSLVITQNPAVNAGAILFQPVATTPLLGMNVDVHMNFHHDSPTPTDVIEASRLITVLGEYDSEAHNRPIEACGTEIVTALHMWTRDINTREFTIGKSLTSGVGFMPTSMPSVVQNVAGILTELAQFDWAPQLQLWFQNGTAPNYTYEFCGSTWDIDNYDMIPDEYISNIHLGCLLSLFKVGTNTES